MSRGSEGQRDLPRLFVIVTKTCDLRYGRNIMKTFQRTMVKAKGKQYSVCFRSHSRVSLPCRRLDWSLSETGLTQSGGGEREFCRGELSKLFKLQSVVYIYLHIERPEFTTLAISHTEDE